MPYFHVEGFQHGQPSDPLYIHADSDETAKTRARELGMVVTGVRLGKEEEVQESNTQWLALSNQVLFHLYLLVPVIMVHSYWYIDRKSQIWPALGVPMIFIMTSFMRMYGMFRQQNETIEMLVVEVKDLRSFVEHQKSAQRVESVR